MASIYDFLMPSLAKGESRFQHPKESNLGAGPGFDSTVPEQSNKILMTISVKGRFSMEVRIVVKIVSLDKCLLLM